MRARSTFPCRHRPSCESIAATRLSCPRTSLHERQMNPFERALPRIAATLGSTGLARAARKRLLGRVARWLDSGNSASEQLFTSAVRALIARFWTTNIDSLGALQR